MNLKNQALPIILSLFAAACGAQATPDYKGEPLLRLRGQLKALTPGAPLPASDVALIWAPPQDMTDPQGTLATRGAISGDFTSFVVDLFQPPPADVLRSEFVTGDDASALGALGQIIAVKQGASLSPEAFAGEAPILLGGVNDAFVVYVDRPMLATHLGGYAVPATQVDEGYYLLSLEFVPTAPSQDMIDACLSTFEGQTLNPADGDPQIICREPSLEPKVELIPNDTSLTMSFN